MRYDVDLMFFVRGVTWDFFEAHVLSHIFLAQINLSHCMVFCRLLNFTDSDTESTVFWAKYAAAFFAT